MAWIAGVDGCKGGWIAVYEDTESGKLDCRVAVCTHGAAHIDDNPPCDAFAAVMSHHPGHRELAVVAVDMPIGLPRGLPTQPERTCDGCARKVLGKRHSSIFSAPAAGVLRLYRDIQKRGEKLSDASASACNKKLTAKGLSKQSCALIPKIAEVENYIQDPDGASHPIYEVHPEVSFAAMKVNGGMIDPKRHPMQFHKATAGGSIERRELLTRVFKGSFEKLESQMPELVGKRAALDDFYDALACLWTARRIHENRLGKGTFGSLPEGASDAPRIVY